MILYGDYHTHTRYSRKFHGKNTIEQNVKIAVKKGLKEIGITEHGFGHKLFGVKRKKIEKMREEINRLNAIYPIKIYLGIEANLISVDGDIDLTEEEQKLFDYVIVGYHQFAKAKDKASKKHFKLNLMAYHNNAYSKNLIEKNTEIYIKAIKNNRVNILSHLNSKMKIDVVKLAEVCKKTGTLIELNGRRLCFSAEETKALIENQTQFIVNSDAHRCKDVGRCNLPMNFIIKNNIPFNLVANLNKKPDFRWKKYE